MYVYVGVYAYTVSFHNFKSQNFKLSVSIPKSKYVVYLSVLSQISNCQSLGRKNKHEILKTDRTHSFRGAATVGVACARFMCIIIVIGMCIITIIVIIIIISSSSSIVIIISGSSSIMM